MNSDVNMGSWRNWPKKTLLILLWKVQRVITIGHPIEITCLKQNQTGKLKTRVALNMILGIRI